MNAEGSLDELNLSYQVYPILPPQGELEFDFDRVDCIVEGPSVAVVTDSQLGKDSLELTDSSSISFPIDSKYRYLAVHLKNVDKFVEIIIKAQCSQSEDRELTMSNRRSNVHIDENRVYMPLHLGPGWQYINVDVAKLIMNAFGTDYISTFEVTISGSTKISKLFMQEMEYSDAELPDYLRLIQ